MKCYRFFFFTEASQRSLFLTHQLPGGPQTGVHVQVAVTQAGGQQLRGIQCLKQERLPIYGIPVEIVLVKYFLP